MSVGMEAAKRHSVKGFAVQRSQSGIMYVLQRCAVSQQLWFAVAVAVVASHRPPPSHSLCCVLPFTQETVLNLIRWSTAYSVEACRRWRRCASASDKRPRKIMSKIIYSFFLHVREIYGPHISATTLQRCLLLELQRSRREFLGRNQSRSQRSSGHSDTCRRKMVIRVECFGYAREGSPS